MANHHCFGLYISEFQPHVVLNKDESFNQVCKYYMAVRPSMNHDRHGPRPDADRHDQGPGGDAEEHVPPDVRLGPRHGRAVLRTAGQEHAAADRDDQADDGCRGRRRLRGSRRAGQDSHGAAGIQRRRDEPGPGSRRRRQPHGEDPRGQGPLGVRLRGHRRGHIIHL